MIYNKQKGHCDMTQFNCKLNQLIKLIYALLSFTLKHAKHLFARNSLKLTCNGLIFEDEDAKVNIYFMR